MVNTLFAQLVQLVDASGRVTYIPNVGSGYGDAKLAEGHAAPLRPPGALHREAAGRGHRGRRALRRLLQVHRRRHRHAGDRRVATSTPSTPTRSPSGSSSASTASPSSTPRSPSRTAPPRSRRSSSSTREREPPARPSPGRGGPPPAVPPRPPPPGRDLPPCTPNSSRDARDRGRRHPLGQPVGRREADRRHRPHEVPPGPLHRRRRHARHERHPRLPGQGRDDLRRRLHRDLRHGHHPAREGDRRQQVRPGLVTAEKVQALGLGYKFIKGSLLPGTAAANSAVVALGFGPRFEPNSANNPASSILAQTLALWR
jgi:hypothetical protein